MTAAGVVAPLGLTPGEPAGIGPDLALMVAASDELPPLVCYADPDVMAARARALNLRVTIADADSVAGCGAPEAGVLRVVRVRAPAAAKPGRLDPLNAPYVLACLDAAMDDCRVGALSGMVTGPVQKSVINDAGIAFSGHTEYLAARLSAPTPVMLLVAGATRVALATTHVPLRAVPDLVTAGRLHAVLAVLEAGLATRFGIECPRICVCGLNPHAGESGHLGREDADVIAPVVEALRAQGRRITGPVPADTAFTPAARGACDAILAMYHDQGLAALKALGFGHAVNVTLGLPIVRTSVDHGTALELAASGQADAGSLVAAVRLAATLADWRDPHAAH